MGVGASAVPALLPRQLMQVLKVSERRYGFVYSKLFFNYFSSSFYDWGRLKQLC